MSRHAYARWGLALALAGSFVTPLSAQTGRAGGEPDSDRYRRVTLERQLNEAELIPLTPIKPTTPVVEQPFLLDWGGIFTYSFATFDAPETDELHRTGHDFDLRVWTRIDIDQVHRVFARGQIDYFQWEKRDAFRRGRNSDISGPFLDIGFYQLDVDRALKKYLQADITGLDATLTIGRQFIYVGRGIAYSAINDGIVWDSRIGDLSLMAFGARSIRHVKNIDRSSPSIRRDRRVFVGGQIAYEGIPKHKPYVYLVAERDRTHEHPEVLNQEFDYDADYLGIGLEGEVWLNDQLNIPNLEYFAEFILQGGRSFPAGSWQHQQDIRASALDVGLQYMPPWKTHPRFLVEYAYASGDEDRLSPTDTSDGNVLGSNDRGFLGFGFLNTGVAFAPRFANLQMLRLGAACKPLEHIDWFKNMEAGVNWFHFWKSESRGGVSDFRADRANTSLGTEADLFINWRLTSDLALILNYGHFWPSPAFTHRKGRDFFGLSVVIRF